MKFEGNPFFWGFIEGRSVKTLAERTNAKYNEPCETIEQKPIGTPYESFVSQYFGVSPNPAFVVSHDKLDPMPFLSPNSQSTEKTTEENCDDTEVNDDDNNTIGEDGENKPSQKEPSQEETEEEKP